MMGETLQSIRGMNDILPSETATWQKLEAILSDIAHGYGYQEIRFPIVESSDLFLRSIGETTDIVGKEMYSFTDRNGDSLSLRPEGTAGCVRACLQHNLLRDKPRLWYLGPMFRHERPQKGRYRQFHQFGAEAFGYDTVEIELELLALSARLWRALGLTDTLKLEINSLGNLEERNRYRQHLIDYFKPYEQDLTQAEQERLQHNPLRLLDSKNPKLQEYIAKAPRLLNELDTTSRRYFQSLVKGLEALDIAYTVNPHLVRGLDYYTHTVFEWTTDQLGAQATVCAGGRYDRLVTQLGGAECPAVGFSIGLERLKLLYQDSHATKIDIYIIAEGPDLQIYAAFFAENLRDAYPKLHIITHCGAGSFKSQFKKADKSGATLALIVEDEGRQSQCIRVKFLRDKKPQITLPYAEFIAQLGDLLN